MQDSSTIAPMALVPAIGRADGENALLVIAVGPGATHTFQFAPKEARNLAACITQLADALDPPPKKWREVKGGGVVDPAVAAKLLLKQVSAHVRKTAKRKR